MSQSPPRRALPCPALSFLTLVEKQNSYNGMTLKFVEYLNFSAMWLRVTTAEGLSVVRP